MKTVGVVVGVLAFLLVMAFAVSGEVKGFVFARLWDQKSTLTCGGSFVMTIKGQKIKMDQGPVFLAGGDCRMRIIDCDIVAPTILEGGGNARVLISGGSFTASQSALSVGGSILVEVKGTQIAGAINRGGDARITGIPELDREQAAEAAQKALDQTFGAHACDGMIDCYKKMGFVGNASARVIGDIAPDGTVTSVKMTGAPGPGADCVRATMKAKTIDKFDGKGGHLVCEFAGMFAAGNQMLNIGGGFRR